MLDPQDRELLLEALRPEPGAVLDAGVGTSFTLDLEALLLAPLAFALFETDDAQRDPTALLAAIQQHASKLALYCDRAHVRTKPSEQKLFVLLEETLVPVAAPSGGAFHPKLWVLRFRLEDGSVRHRVIVLSRNLTFDTSWDLLATLDESLDGVLPGADVAAVLDGLNRLAPSDVTRDLMRTVRSAQFDVPEPFTEGRLHSFGLSSSSNDVVRNVTGDRSLVVSPFLTAERLSELRATSSGRRTLVSRAPELERIGESGIEGWATPMVLREAADADPARDTGLKGLHAKLYVTDHAEVSTWFVGSANATTSALDRNVETLLELRGPRNKVGVGSLLSEAGKEVRFRTLLEEFPLVGVDPSPRMPRDEDEDRLEAIAKAICAQPLVVRVSPSGDGHQLRLRLKADASELESGDSLSARPVTRSSWAEADLRSDPLAEVHVPKVSEITSLIAFRLSSGRDLAEPREFVMRGELIDAPDNRIDQLLIDLIPDKRRFALLLFLMLAAGDPDAGTAAEARSLLGGGHAASTGGDGLGIPLYEALVRASARDVDRLRAIDQVVKRLTQSEEGASRLPDGFADMWESFRPLLTQGQR